MFIIVHIPSDTPISKHKHKYGNYAYNWAYLYLIPHIFPKTHVWCITDYETALFSSKTKAKTFFNKPCINKVKQEYMIVEVKDG